MTIPRLARPWCAAALLALAALARAGDRELPLRGDISAVTRDRPRMLFTRRRLESLRRRVETDPACREMFSMMRRRADGMLAMRPALDNQGRHYLPSFALLYAITGEERYARLAAQWLFRMSEQTLEDPWTCLEFIPTGAFAFDWIHATLTPAERTRAARGLLRQLERIKKLWRHSDYNNHFLLEHMSQLHVALALAHEPGFEREAQRLFTEAEVWLKRHVIPASSEMAGGAAGAEAGGHAEGFSYNNWGYARPFGRLLAAWKSATGENLFPCAVQLQHDAIWNAYGRLPDGTLARSEDCPSGVRWGEDVRSTFELVAREYRDGIARTLADGIEVRYPQVLWPILVFRDATVKPSAPARLPRARLFAGLGHVYSRSAWEDEDAVATSFQCGPIFTGHQHLDNNAFTIFYRGRLAIDSGVNEYSSHRANYYSRTVAHNTITVLDPAETFPAAVWSHAGGGGSNDGGQRRVPFPVRATARDDEKAVREVGRITRFELTDEYCYAVGDATRSYRKSKVKRFLRHFLHLFPDLVVVLDEVETGRAGFETRWLLHTIREPRVDLDRGRLEVKNRGGALTVWCLLPGADDRAVSVIGGPGREYVVRGRNYPPDSKRDENAGAYRVEVLDTRRSRRHVFLHVLLASPADRRAAEAERWSVAASQTGGRVRLSVDRRAGGGRPAVHRAWTWERGGWLRPAKRRRE